MTISIHAPRAGSDYGGEPDQNFNPRSPCGERRALRVMVYLNSENFNPRSPCGERRVKGGRRGSGCAISIHAPRAGSDGRDCGAGQALERISIHAPRAGSDRRHAQRAILRGDFNPRSPCGERPSYLSRRATPSKSFQSTLPVRGATGLDTPACNAERISIHAPRAGSDKKVDKQALFTEISIHAPRAGSDSRRTGACRPVPYFNPRSPCGERLADF